MGLEPGAGGSKGWPIPKRDTSVPGWAIPEPGPGRRSTPAAVWALALGKLLLHLLTANRYGLFRDEMYGLACADHMAWGYVDHPPGGILIAWVARHLFGDSPLGLRLLPAAAGAALVWLTARLAREMGGGSFAQGVAALGICLVPVYTVFDHWLMMNAFEPLIWAGFAWCLLRVADGGDRRLWLALGVLAGVGLETKYSIAFLMVGVLAGLALTPRRSELRSPWPWVGVGVAALIALPNVLWQAGHHFPFLELTRNIGRSGRDVVRDPLAFILDQAVIMGPTTLPLWAGGLGWLLVGRGRRRFAVLGWAFLFVLGAFIALKGKNYYVTPAYPMLFAAGAAGLEIATAPRARRWIRAAYGTAASAGGLILLPLSAPLLPPESLIRYEHALRIVPPDFEHQRNGPLPQYFADEFGWEDMVREVARVYHALPAAEQAGTAIFSNGWGEAAAVDFYGPRYGLPRAISTHNSYWMWGPRGYTGGTVIVLRSDGRGDREHFASVVAAGRVGHPYARRDEQFDILVCRGLNTDLRDLWPRIRSFE